MGSEGEKWIDRLLALGVIGSVVIGLLVMGVVGVAIYLIAAAFR